MVRNPRRPVRRRVLPKRVVRDGAGRCALPTRAGAGGSLDGRRRRRVDRRAGGRPGCRTVRDAGGARTPRLRTSTDRTEELSKSRRRYLMSTQPHHHARTLIVGGGAGGLSVAARLRRAGENGIVVVEPSDVNYYQPAWSLVGAGLIPLRSTVRPEAKVMPRGVTWLRTAVTRIDPNARLAHLADGDQISYETLVLAAGIELHWDAIPGMTEALRTERVSSNYSFDLAEKTWSIIRRIRPGTVVFTRPTGKAQRPSAAQKITHLPAHSARRPGARIYDTDEFSDVLDTLAADTGIEVHTSSELRAIDAENRRISITDLRSNETWNLHYDALHVVPPQSAASWIRESGLSDPGEPGGWVKVDRLTLQHPDFPEVFALGDNAGTTNGKTASAVRDQAPVVAKNVRAVLSRTTAPAKYSGYGACPITIGGRKVFLAEADYSGKYAPKL